jgi:hypothetical protein
MSLEERARYRREKAERQYRREIEALPKGWYDFTTDHYLVLSNASRKYTNDVVRHAEAIRAYLEETFGNLGVDYVPPAILRVFATYPEYEAYVSGTKRLWGSSTQLLSVEGWTEEAVNWSVTSQWLEFKNEDLMECMPSWINSGLRDHMRFARSSGKNVKFEFGEWDQRRLRALLESGKAAPLKDLISGLEEQKREEEAAKSGGAAEIAYWTTGVQAGSVVTYLLTTGDRGKTKGALAKYLRGLVGALEQAQGECEAELERIRKEEKAAAEQQAAEDAGKDDKEEDEELEEKRSQEQIKLMQQRRDALKKRSKTLREKAFEVGFGHLTDKDWKTIDAAWRRFVK